MIIIILGVRIIEDSDNRGSDNRGCTVYFNTIANLVPYTKRTVKKLNVPIFHHR